VIYNFGIHCFVHFSSNFGSKSWSNSPAPQRVTLERDVAPALAHPRATRRLDVRAHACVLRPCILRPHVFPRPRAPRPHPSRGAWEPTPEACRAPRSPRRALPVLPARRPASTRGRPFLPPFAPLSVARWALSL
jgi:hypothetical protein